MKTIFLVILYTLFPRFRPKNKCNMEYAKTYDRIK